MFVLDSKPGWIPHMHASSPAPLLAIITKRGVSIRKGAVSKHFWGVNEQNSTVNSVVVDDWTAELPIITSTDSGA